MKIYTSYFYQVRFFKPYQIPVSTAIWDPKWFHEFKEQNHIWKDKNGVWNGIRLELLNPGPNNCDASGCPCKERNPESCKFMREYIEGLRRQNFDSIISFLIQAAEFIKKEEGFDEEPEIILLVHEDPNNPCSERLPLQKYFRDHGIEVNEWVKNKEGEN